MKVRWNGWVLLPVILVALSCGDSRGGKGADRDAVERDLAAISADTLRVGVLEDALSWERRTYGNAGLEWELIASFSGACHLNVVPVPMVDLSELHEALLDGRVDVIAAQVGADIATRPHVATTRSYADVLPVLLFRRPTDAKRKALVDTVCVPAGSLFSDKPLRLKGAFSKLTCAMIATTAAPSLDNVILGKQDAVVVTHLAAARALEQFPHLGGVLCSDRRSPLVFAVRDNAPDLLAALNAHLADGRVARTIARELDDLRFTERTSALTVNNMALSSDTISRFDNLFRRVADEHGLDWHLLAAIAFRESGFDSSAVSNMGAHGLMQMMPATAKRFKGGKASEVEKHVIAAAVYLRELDTLWQRTVPDRQQRHRFVLASYNAGEGHILDAQRLAERFGLRKDRWEHHVERALLLLSCPRHWRKEPVRHGFCKGSETYRYVRNVLGTWHHFGTVPDEIPTSDTLGIEIVADTTVIEILPDTLVPDSGTQVPLDSVVPPATPAE